MPAKDPATGLPTYDAFSSACENQVASAAEEGEALAMGLVDIDWFGKLNRAHGRDAGDALLTRVAARLADLVGDRGSIYRFGGDAFSVLLPGMEKEQAFLLMEEARRELDGNTIVDKDGKTLQLAFTVSIGVAGFPDDGEAAPAVIRKMNEALYRAKVGGRDKVCLAREEKMLTKTSHYAQGQLYGLARLAKREGLGEAELLREALDDLLRKYNA